MSEVTEGKIRQSLGEWGREEGAFAVALGISSARLKELREEHLEEGVHWGRRRRKIVYRVGGEVKMKGVVALLVGVEEGEVEVSEEVGREGEESLEVLKIFPVNRRLVECGLVGGGKVMVNVGDNVNFMKGMTLTARPPWGGKGRLWVLVGSRPRWRGKW